MKNKIDIFLHLLSTFQWIILIISPSGIVIVVVITMPLVNLPFIFWLWLLLFVCIMLLMIAANILIRLKSDELNAPKIKIFEVEKYSMNAVVLHVENIGSKGKIRVSSKRNSGITTQWIDLPEKKLRMIFSIWPIEDESLDKGEIGYVKINLSNIERLSDQIIPINFRFPKIQQVSTYAFHIPCEVKNVSVTDFEFLGTYDESDWLKKKIVEWRMQ